MDKFLLEALSGKRTERVPFWFMRQAGRYLPEYRELRTSVGGFMELCFHPEKAAEVTLQPIRRFHMDGAILFSDILVIPHALGVTVTFAEGEGPVVQQVGCEAHIDSLTFKLEKLSPVFETVRLVKKQLPEDVTLIGFAGSPWTVACYMLEGPRNKGKDFPHALHYAKTEPVLMQKIVDKLVDSTIVYLQQQTDAGVEALQLFDSWAGLLPKDQFEAWVIAPTKRIVSALKESHPHVPIIGFARGAGEYAGTYVRTGIDCIGVDQHTDIKKVISLRANPGQAVQGNLDPELLMRDKTGALRQAESILKTFGNAPGVFNFGHGMLPTTPVEHVAALCDYLRQARRA